jgi:hypothetical protein
MMGVKVGYLTDVSCRNVSISRGDDLMDMADIKTSDADLKTVIIYLFTFVRYDRQIGHLTSQFLDATDFTNTTAACQNRFPQDKKQLW